ncbi:hypothetical protein [uncultured Campylobacter sp.]|uniref:hypothetical protein n=1 Tax=uncultured Campylobacter sp. TaxID=218934 RepID=UPI002623C3D1|nr:hypothetical protein [uncultured Campylobacter sp.]
MSWGRNRLQRFIGPKIRALFGLGQTDPRIKINPLSNKAHEHEPGFTHGLRKIYFACGRRLHDRSRRDLAKFKGKE